MSEHRAFALMAGWALLGLGVIFLISEVGRYLDSVPLSFLGGATATVVIRNQSVPLHRKLWREGITTEPNGSPRLAALLFFCLGLGVAIWVFWSGEAGNSHFRLACTGMIFGLAIEPAIKSLFRKASR